MQIKDYQVFLLGVMIALGSVFSTYILSKAVVDFQKLQNQTIRVTGSASEKVTSDSASWTIRYSAKNQSLKGAYSKLEADSNKIKAFFKSQGINENTLEFSVVDNYPQYKKFPGSYNTTNEVDYYIANQSVTVKSKDITKLTEISKKVNLLVNDDIELNSEAVQYYVSNLDDLKIKAAAEAAKNAKERAKSMIKGTNGKIGVMTSAKLGVFQIVPVDSTEVNDYGINDTSTIEKKVVATVSATFTVK